FRSAGYLHCRSGLGLWPCRVPQTTLLLPLPCASRRSIPSSSRERSSASPLPCAASVLRYNPRHYGEAQNQGPAAGPTESPQNIGVGRKTAKRRGHSNGHFARPRGHLLEANRLGLPWPFQNDRVVAAAMTSTAQCPTITGARFFRVQHHQGQDTPGRKARNRQSMNRQSNTSRRKLCCAAHQKSTNRNAAASGDDLLDGLQIVPRPSGASLPPGDR